MTRLKLSPAHIIAVGPDSRKAGWGPFQFPNLFQTGDGTLVCSFRDCADSEAAYNDPSRRFFSTDRGEHWTETAYDAFAAEEGLLLDNGERILFEPLSSIPESDVQLPKPIGSTFLFGSTAYRASDFPKDVLELTWPMQRVLPDGTVLREKPILNWPYAFVRTRAGVLVRPAPRGRLRQGPDGTLWMPHYTAGGVDPENGGYVPYHCIYLFSSSDRGHSWNLRDFLPYTPDIRRHPLAFYLEGWNENDIGFAPDGTMFRLLRLDGRWPPRHTPMHITWSSDGEHWSEPIPFDDHGVWPCILPLACGVTLASYGRPGVQLRATEDPSCRKWDAPVELVHSDGLASDDPANVLVRATCAYTEMIALDDRTAGLVYSDFTIRDEAGTPRKTILFRTVTVL